jgi:uncharacterized protein (TIGR00730 family)
MTLSPSSNSYDLLRADMMALLERLPSLKHGDLLQTAFATLMRLAEEDVDRLDWKICNAALRDMEVACRAFYPYRHVRKISIFGSARTSPDVPEYHMAREFARRIAEQGFMIMTGAGGGIMQAGNEGAGRDHSFGLNIQLPFEQGSNPYIEGDPKLISFKYFFTRKVFFLKECDAAVSFPGGFGTQDEAFECLTLCQTGKSSPIPLVLVDKPGGDYWHEWNNYIHRQLLRRGLISAEDPTIYTITDRIDVACEAIAQFYTVFHSCRYMGEDLIIRMTSELSEEAVDQLNKDFSDILVRGRIEQGKPLPQDDPDTDVSVAYLVLTFNQRDLGRLYQLIAAINCLGNGSGPACHPEIK